ncbi:rRNA biogenesis protein RRP5 (AtRrp5) (Ribosomal RNA-processing protein 5), partial [Durusdinium trenchii]
QDKKNRSKKQRTETDPVFRDIELQKRKKKAAFGDDGGREEYDLDARPKRAYTLRMKTLGAGVQMLGIVTQVSKMSATVSLPCNLVGFVAVENASDQHEAGVEGVEMDLSKGLLTVGQVVRCVSLGVGTGIGGETERHKKRIMLSLAASRINRAETMDAVRVGSAVCGNVASVEDHGYQVSLGLDNAVSAFLPFDVAGGSVDEPKLAVGQVVEAVVASITDGSLTTSTSRRSKKRKTVGQGGLRRVFRLDNDPAKVRTASASGRLALEALQPGMLVKAQTSSYLLDGVYMFFLGMFHGTADRFHMENWKLDPKMYMGKAPTSSADVAARILFVDLENKQVALTCARRLVHRTEEDQQMDATILSSCVGSVLQDCKVKRIDERKGVLLRVPRAEVPRPKAANVVDGDEEMSAKQGKGETVFAYARRNRIDRDMDSDDVVELDKHYKVGQVTRCKVLSHAAIDGVMNVSLSKSVIEASVLRYGEIKPGMKVSGKIFRVMDNAVLVALSEQVRAIVPGMHLSDVKITDPARRFKVGQLVKCKVLDTNFDDMSAPKVSLTMKKTLLNSSEVSITSFTEAKPGTVAHGVVTKVDDAKGIWVTFFDNVFGFVSMSELSSLGVQVPSSAYKVSEVAEEGQGDRDGAFLVAVCRGNVRVEHASIPGVGKVVKVKVLSCNPERRRMALSFRTLAASREESGESQVQVGQSVSGKVVSKSKHELHVRLDDSKATAVLPVSQLSDHRGHTELLFHKYRPGTRLERLLVLQFNQDGIPVLSLKPVLALALESNQLPTTVDEMQPNTMVFGYVQNANKLGVFVSFLGGLTGLAPLAEIHDDFVRDGKAHYAIGQTVCAKVLEVDEARSRVILSLKASAVDVAAAFQVCFVQSYMDEEKLLHGEGKAFAAAIGDVVDATLTKTSKLGTELDVNGKPAIHLSSLPGNSSAEAKTGDTVEVRVLDHNFGTGMLDVSMDRDLVTKGKRNVRKKSRKAAHAALKNAEELDARVELVRNGAYAIVSIPSLDQQLAVVPLAVLNATQGTAPQAGASCQVVLLQTTQASFEHLAVARMVFTAQQRRKRSRSRGNSVDFSALCSAPRKLEVGAVLQGKIRDVNTSWIHVDLPPANNSSDFAEGSSLRGQLHISKALSGERLEEAVRNNESAFEGFNVGDAIKVRVDAFEEVPDSKVVNVILSVPEGHDDGTADAQGELTLDQIEVGARYSGVVQGISSEGVVVALSRHARGFVFCTQVSRDLGVLEAMFGDSKRAPQDAEVLHVHDAVEVRVIQVAPEKNRLQLSMIH